MNIKDLLEARFQEIVHTNPSIATLKALARNNKYHSARFVIYNDGTLVAGDSLHFTHHSMAPAMGAWAIRGYVQYLGDDDYAYRSMEVHSPLSVEHPMFRVWERSGIENGNPEVVEEKWSAKYKRSIDCHHPKGFSQRAHCAGRRKRQAHGKTTSASVNESKLNLLVENAIELLITQGLSEAQAVKTIDQQLTEDLRKWFRDKWVRFGPDGKIRGTCARGSEGEGKPKCLPQKKAWALGKKKRATAASRKRREDPNPERHGKARNVSTTESQATNQAQCPHCGGDLYPITDIMEKKDACYYKVKSRYKVWPSAYASGALVQCRKKGAKNWGKTNEQIKTASILDEDSLRYNISANLAKWANMDQKLRREYQQFTQSKFGGDYDASRSEWIRLHGTSEDDFFGTHKQEHEIHQKLLKLMPKIAPLLPNFSPQDWHNLWLLAQHADQLPQLQRQVLKILKQYGNVGSNAKNIQYLTDRILSNQGRRQRYHTQGGEWNKLSDFNKRKMD